jgi:hypothetical protein
MNTNMRKRLLKIGLLFMALVAMIVGIALPAYADNRPTSNNPAYPIVQGKVTDIFVSNTSFELLTANNNEVTITTNTSTQFYIIPAGKVLGAVNSLIAPNKNEDKGKGNLKQNAAARLNETKELHIPADWKRDLGWLAFFDNPASFSDIEVNDRVIVRTDKDNLAKQVLIIKAPVIRTIKGTISLVDSTHIQITPTSGIPLILNVVGTTSIVLHGQTSISGYAVAVYNSDNKNAVKVNVYATAPPND